MGAVGVGVMLVLTRAGWAEEGAGMVATLAALGVLPLVILWDEWQPLRWRERQRQRERAAAEHAAAVAAREARRRRPCADMDRAKLLDHLAEFGPFHHFAAFVSYGQIIDMDRAIMDGMHTADLRDLCARRREWSGLLPGETRDGWSVYRVRFLEDGAAYVGMTGGTVIDRLGRHLRGETGAGIYRRCRRGMVYRFDVLASGLDERTARRVELAEIGKLRRPLNVIGARYPTGS